jgi:hypothetical protein
VGVNVAVAVGEGVFEGVAEGVRVGVRVKVSVGVGEGVWLGVSVKVGVNVEVEVAVKVEAGKNTVGFLSTNQPITSIARNNIPTNPIIKQPKKMRLKRLESFEPLIAFSIHCKANFTS